MLSQKLDLIMKVTNTKNSALGRALSFDSSYIGRIRTGKRGLPKNQPFIQPVASFFARNMKEAYQKITIAEIVCPGRSWPEEKEEAESLLIAWFMRDDAITSDSVESILFGLSAMPDKKASYDNAKSIIARTSEHKEFYYGNSGKREAVEAFLTGLCACDTPQSLLLYSNEDMSWLYEDRIFVQHWAALLIEIISKGGHIKIIHTVSRDIGEMLEAVQKWLPLYASGAIEPYFYPKLRDNIYRRTLFIAKGRSAIISSSIGSHTQESLNILVNSEPAVRALEVEFMDYFNLCKPLMRIYNLRNNELFWKALKEFEESGGNFIITSPVPSYFTLPEDVATNMAVRNDCRWILQNQNDTAQRFVHNLSQGNSVTELLNLPSLENVRDGLVRIPLCDLFGHPSLCYTLDEFKSHLKNIIRLLQIHENYNVIVSNQNGSEYLLLVKEDIGVIMSKSAPPSTVFGISERSMTAAFWEYLQRSAPPKSNKDETIIRLSEYLDAL